MACDLISISATTTDCLERFVSYLFRIFLYFFVRATYGSSRWHALLTAVAVSLSDVRAISICNFVRSNSTPLSQAAAKGHLGVVKILLERGAAVNLPGRGGLTPLHEAAGCGQVGVCASDPGGTSQKPGVLLFCCPHTLLPG